METIVKELALYDLFAYLVPGTVVVWAVLRAYESITGTNAIAWSWKLLVVSYIAGHLVQAMVTPARSWPWQAVPDHSLEQLYPGSSQAQLRSDIKSAIDQAFNNPPQQSWFQLCGAYVQTRKIDAFSEIMRARHGFFRGLYASLAVAALALLIAALHAYASHKNRYRDSGATFLLLALLCLFGAWLSHKRMMDFDQYYSETIYRTFYVDFVSSQHQSVRQ